jgi:hypothetical protein
MKGLSMQRGNPPSTFIAINTLATRCRYAGVLHLSERTTAQSYLATPNQTVS